MTYAKRLTLWAAALTVSVAAAPAFAQDAALAGSYWQTEDHKFILRLADCGDTQLCADLVWLLRPLHKDSLQPKSDRYNSDPARHADPVCGMRLVTGLTPDPGDGDWEDGRFYNPDDGKPYGASMKREGADELSIRVFLGMEMLGKTMRMRQVDAPVETCEGRAEAAMADIENYVAKTPGSPWVGED